MFVLFSFSQLPSVSLFLYYYRTSWFT